RDARPSRLDRHESRTPRLVRPGRGDKHRRPCGSRSALSAAESRRLPNKPSSTFTPRLSVPAQCLLGIDLGTTNCVVAYAALGTDTPEIHLLPIPQLVAPGVVEERTTLPSFLYLGTEAETGTFDLPWATGRTFAVGEAA